MAYNSYNASWFTMENLGVIMAERYPTYKRQIGVSSLPSVDYTQLKEQAKGYSNVADAMSKMSNYFFKQAGELAETEGKQWGAANPITLTQLETMNTTGEVPDVLKDDWSIFGKAAKEASIVSAANNMEASAKREFVNILSVGKANGTPSLEIQKQLDGVILGFVESLMEVDTVTAQKLNASLSVSASSAWQTYVNDELTQIAGRNKAALAFISSDFVNNELINLVEGGVGIDGGIDIAYQEIKRKVIKQTFGTDIRGASDTFTLKLVDMFDKAYLQARKNSIIKYVTDDDALMGERNLEFYNGEFKDSRIQEIYNSLEQDEKMVLTEDIIKAHNKNYELKEKKEELLEKTNLKIIKEKTNKFYEALIYEKDYIKAEDLLNEITELDVGNTVAKEIFEAFNKKESYIQSDPGTIQILTLALSKDSLTTNLVLEQYNNNNLNTADFTTWMGKAAALQDNKVKEALEIVKSELGIDDTFTVYTATGAPRRTLERKVYDLIKTDILRTYADYKATPAQDKKDSPFVNELGVFDVINYATTQIRKEKTAKLSEFQERDLKEFQRIVGFQKNTKRIKNTYNPDDILNLQNYNQITPDLVRKVIDIENLASNREKNKTGWKTNMFFLRNLLDDLND